MKGKVVRAMVRNEDERAHALRHMGAEVVVGDLLEPADVSGSSAAVGGSTSACPIRRLLGSDHDYGGGRSGTWSQRSGQHVADDRSPRWHSEHHAEPQQRQHSPSANVCLIHR